MSIVFVRRVAAYLRGCTSSEIMPETIGAFTSRNLSSASDELSSNKTTSQTGAAKLQRKNWDASSSSPSPSVPSRQPRFDARQPSSGKDKRRQQAKGKPGESQQRKGKGQMVNVKDLVEEMMKKGQESLNQSGQQTPAEKLLANAMAPYAIDTDRLALLKYILPDEKVQDRELAMKKLKATMFRSPEKIHRMMEADFKMASNPNFQLEKEIITDPRAVNNPPPSPEALLDNAKENLRALFGLDDAEFEKHKEIAAKNFREKSKFSTSNPKIQEEELQKLVDEKLSKDHYLYGSVISKLQTLQHNPNWPHERKVVFMKRVLKTVLSSA